MATYAIGDVQGCYDQLIRLLEECDYTADKDQLWFCGDIVNRGPKSLETLRLIRHLQPEPIVVLGNHDLHLLARAENLVQAKKLDTLEPILTATDRDDLLQWLRQRPLLHHDPILNYTMVHAGLPPQWDLPTACDYAHEIESALRSDDYYSFLKNMYGDEPAKWDPDLSGWERLRFICNALTRMRFCDANGRLNLKNRGKVGTQQQSEMPWFQIPNRAHKNLRLIFGHWAALKCKTDDDNIIATDSGCVWGRSLTAIRLQDGQRITVSCH